MKPRILSIIAIILGGAVWLSAQSDFNLEAYRQFVEDNRDLPAATLLARHVPAAPWYSSIEGSFTPARFSYLDSIQLKFGLTADELTLLEGNRFMVTERLTYGCFRDALMDIFHLDLPVFVTTDAILHALHASYDKILMDLELYYLRPRLAAALDAMSTGFPGLVSKYADQPALSDPLRDVDLYLTVARSLLADAELAPQLTEPAAVHAVLEAIQSEMLVKLPLFTDVDRGLDFSQFTVRGHYTDEPELSTYFQCMIWLGRIDFIMTDPPVEWKLSYDGLRRMNMGALLLNELLDLAAVRTGLDEIDCVIEFLVGESDNLTPTELSGVTAAQGLTGADGLLDDTAFDGFRVALKATPEYGQRILSMIIQGRDSLYTDPVELPVSFRLMGQRFIVDSQVFSRVVYDRIVYQGAKIKRMMPDPLDAMFALGNDDALPLLSEELDRYPYAAQLAEQRYLVDTYDDSFWNLSLYNVWLKAIRTLNAPQPNGDLPLFMKTTAWRQQKLNTQLASWSQLRHDNLLYAKQSYTGGAVCSFPHSYVEPYPEFYRAIGDFADKSGAYFEQLDVSSMITYFFGRMSTIMDTLETIAQKELDRQPFNEEEKWFLKRMLYQSGGCVPVFNGWYTYLFYNGYDDPAGEDFVIADVHTQPTDEGGAIVGKVLHVAVGPINLGVFLAPSPSSDFQTMAFVGPVMSYYEHVTEMFDRFTDERWEDLVKAKDLPPRPDWVNIYLADSLGVAFFGGRQLPGITYTDVGTHDPDGLPERFMLAQNYPNPFNPATTLRYELPRAVPVSLIVYDLMGRKISTLVNERQPAGEYRVLFEASHLPSGIYLARLIAGEYHRSIKLLLMK